MAIGDLFAGGMLTANVMMRFKADTSEAKRELKSLTGEEKKAQEAAIALQEQKNRQLDSWAKGIAKVTVGMQLAQKAVSMLGDSWKAYEKHALAAGGADMEKAKKFRDALSSMDASVNKFAIAIGGLVAELAPLVKVASGLVDIISTGIGMLNRGVAGLGPGRGEAYEGQWSVDSAIGATPGEQRVYDMFGINPTPVGTTAADIAARKRRRAMQQISNDPTAWGAGGNEWDLARRQEAERAQRRGGGGFTLNAHVVEGGFRVGENAFMSGESQQRLILGIADAITAAARKLAGPERDRVGDMLSESKRNLALSGALDFDQDAFNLQNWRDAKGNMLEQAFGPVEQFSAYAAGFDLLSSSVTAAWEAVITGSKGAAAAFKQAAGGALFATSLELIGLSVKHGAMGAGALAIGGPLGGLSAAAHFKAAGIAFAGATFTGGLAKGLGAGGSTPSVTGGGGGYAGGGGSGGSGSTRQGTGGGDRVVNVYYGDVWSEDSPRRRRNNVERAMRSGKRVLEEDRGILNS